MPPPCQLSRLSGVPSTPAGPKPLQTPSPTAVLEDTPPSGPTCPAPCVRRGLFLSELPGWSQLYSRCRCPESSSTFSFLWSWLQTTASSAWRCMRGFASWCWVTLGTLDFQSLGWICLGRHPPTGVTGLGPQRMPAKFNGEISGLHPCSCFARPLRLMVTLFSLCGPALGSRGDKYTPVTHL